MGLFSQNNKSCMSVMNLSLTDKDDELERIKKADSRLFNASFPVLSLVNDWRNRILSLAADQVDIMEITIDTKKIASVFSEEVKQAASRITGVAAATEEMSSTAREIAKNAQAAAGEAGASKKPKRVRRRLKSLFREWSRSNKRLKPWGSR